MFPSPQTPRGLVKAEFIFETAPFPSCHASTIVETRAGLVAAWFGGTAERNPDVGIWVSRYEGRRGRRPSKSPTASRALTRRYPTWNPGAVPAVVRPAAAVLQGRPQPEHLVGDGDDVGGRGPDVVQPKRLPDGILGPDQEQARPARERRICSRGRAPNTTAGGFTSSARPIDGPHGPRRRRSTTASDFRDSAEHPHTQGRPASGGRTHAQRQDLRDLVQRRRPHLGRDLR